MAGERGPVDVDQQHELVALNADVVGYSALVADDVDATSSMMTRLHRLVERRVEENHGAIANFVGDSFMAVFDDAMAALRAAITIATDLEAQNADVPTRRRVRLRMGMDRGAVTFADGNHHGDALNIAARIQAIARPGGLAVSGRVYRALDEPALRFRAMGRQSLKNIPEQVDVHEFVDLPSDGAGRTRRGSLHLESPTLVVLPIHVEGVDERVRSAAGMIRLDLLHRLALMPDVTVIDAPAEPGGGASGTARYMVETGVHQFGEAVKVFAVVFDMGTMNVVKSHKWTSTVDEMFSLSEGLADEVAHAIEVDLVVGEPARMYAELDDPVAVEQVYLGWYHLRNDTLEGWQRALEMFGQVADTHPEEPYGFVLSAFAWWLGTANQWAADPDRALDIAEELARKGAAVGDQTGMAQAVRAAIQMSRGSTDEALRTLDELDIVRPTCDITYGLEGSIRRYLGQWERSIELLDHAMRLTGINKPWYPTVKACSLFVGGRLEEAEGLAEEVLDHQPNNLEALLVLAAAQWEMGLQRRASATIDLVRDRFPTVDVEHWLDQSPYQRREIIERWKGDLASAGAISGP